MGRENFACGDFRLAFADRGFFGVRRGAAAGFAPDGGGIPGCPDALDGVTGRGRRRAPRGGTSAGWRRFRPSPGIRKRYRPHHRPGARRACRCRRARLGPAGRLTGQERPCLCCCTIRNARLMSPYRKDAALMASRHKDLPCCGAAGGVDLMACRHKVGVLCYCAIRWPPCGVGPQGRRRDAPVLTGVRTRQIAACRASAGGRP